MIDFYFREPSGRLVMSGNCAEAELHLQSFNGATLEVGKADIHKQYYKNGLRDYPPKPDDFYVFDYVSEAWVADIEKATSDALTKRDQLLKDGPDRISPLWWNSMTTQDQQVWTTYRQALLDITQQPGFPTDISWPVSPV